MTGPERDADFAVGLEPADAWTVPGARIDHDERPAGLECLGSFRRDDAHECIVDRAIEPAAVEHQLDLVVQDVRRRLGNVLMIRVAAFAHHVPKQNGALGGVGQIFRGSAKQSN